MLKTTKRHIEYKNRIELLAIGVHDQSFSVDSALCTSRDASYKLDSCKYRKLFLIVI